MYARSSAIRLLIRAGMVVGAVFAVTILLAAMPGHNAPSVAAISAPLQQVGGSQQMPGMDHAQTSQDAIAEKAHEKPEPSDLAPAHKSLHAANRPEEAR